jgi:hypothetical protein
MIVASYYHFLLLHVGDRSNCKDEIKFRKNEYLCKLITFEIYISQISSSLKN